MASEAYPDHTQFDENSEYYDPKSRKEKPKWWMVDVKPVEKFANYVPLSTLRETKGLESMITLRRGNRLSITPVTETEWKIILNLGGSKTK